MRSVVVKRHWMYRPTRTLRCPRLGRGASGRTGLSRACRRCASPGYFLLSRPKYLASGVVSLEYGKGKRSEMDGRWIAYAWSVGSVAAALLSLLQWSGGCDACHGGKDE